MSTPVFSWQAVPGTPVSVVVTLEPRREKTIPTVEQQDISVYQGKDRRPVTGFVALRGPMQLMLLIDDSARSSFNTEISALKSFVNALPSETEVAIGYMRNGYTQVAQEFTRNHAAAANAIRLPMGPGGADVSPYDSLADAIKKWPESGTERKQVIMISSGIEGLGGGFYRDNPYVTAGIDAAVRAGVVVYTIYSPSVGHYGHSLWRTTWGQNFLSELSDQTGGESYMIGFGSPVSFQPFLEQIRDHQNHQYRLTFEARAEQKSGFQPFRTVIENKDASIAAPDKVYVKASL
ncbi:MAG TPA: hypothetical protein VH601_19795 [Bryobacteraceae bacterium]